MRREIGFLQELAAWEWRHDRFSFWRHVALVFQIILILWALGGGWVRWAMAAVGLLASTGAVLLLRARQDRRARLLAKASQLPRHKGRSLRRKPQAGLTREHER
jgi:hypothetical protein